MIFLLTSGILTTLILTLSWFFIRRQGRSDRAPAQSASTILETKESAEKITYWRISGIPEDCDKDKLIDFLRKHDNSLKIDLSDLSLFPGCYSQKQVGVLRTKGIPESFQRIKPEGDYVSISGLSTGGVTIDRNFYNLTPLNRPEGGNSIVDVVAVTGLAGHAFGSWRNRESGKMWLQDFLPNDIKNIRVLTYGYNSNLIGNTVDDTLQDQRSNLFIQLLNVRNTAEVAILTMIIP
ncbi:uncharacterized protein H6S33_003676 [Morchella sextelata]|uniref:uncharacterized protein n=1 Tax=Morchella sextelata TaxID=1174677 RepID=UPI001D0369F3|nr:uncharacterized protein H6S33_003676 [Morchella sextelata]KAH0606842.1 hypothetical protein H6S33_003676 [Morchella sextelata]